MLSFDGWSVGIGFCLKIIIDITISAFFIYKAKKNNIKLLYYAAFVFIPYILSYSIYMIEFFHILMTDTNMEITKATLLIYFTGYIIVGISGVYLGFNLILKEKRKLMLIIVSLYYVFIEILAFILPNSGYTLSYPPSPGENLTRIYSTANSIIYYISFPPILFNIFIAISLLFKGLKVKGNIRKKFISLSLAFGTGTLFYIISISFPYVGIDYIIIFLVIASLGWIPFYYGLTPIKAKKPKKKKTPSDIELKFVSYLRKKSGGNQSLEGEYISAGEIDREILVFMSYATKDADLFKVKEIAEKLTDTAEIEKVLYWQEDMEDNIIGYMNDNLGKCHTFVLFCSKNAMESVPVKKEWTAADAMGKPIIPVFFNPEHIPPLLRSRLGMEFDFYDIERNVQELRFLILKKCRGSVEDSSL